MDFLVYERLLRCGACMSTRDLSLREGDRAPRPILQLAAHQSPSPSTVPMAVPKAVGVLITLFVCKKKPT